MRNLILFVIALWLIGSGLLIWHGETHPPKGYAVKVPGGIEIYP